MDRRPDPTTNEDDEEGPGRLRSETSMNVKRILKQPLLWVLLVFVGLMLALNLTSDTEYQRVDTSQAVQLINGGQVSKAEFTGDDRIDLTLSSPQTVGEAQNVDKVYTLYVPQRGEYLTQLVREHAPAQGYNDEPPQTTFLGSLLMNLLPIIILIALFWFLLSRMQGGGGRIMQFGKSKAKLASKDMPKVTFAAQAGSAGAN